LRNLQRLSGRHQSSRLLGAVGADAEGDIDGLVADRTLVAHLDPQRVEEDHRVEGFAPLPEQDTAAGTTGVETPNAWRPILPAPHPLPNVLRHRRHGTPSKVWRYPDQPNRSGKHDTVSGSVLSGHTT